MTKKRMRFIVLKVDSSFHINMPWIIVDLLHDKCIYAQTKKVAYEFIQKASNYGDKFIDITEVD